MGEMPGARGQVWALSMLPWRCGMQVCDDVNGTMRKTKILGALGISDPQCLVARSEMLED